MNKLASQFREAIHPTQRQDVAIFADHIAMESLVHVLMDSLPALNFLPTYGQVSQESQQQDHNETKKALVDVEAKLKSLLKPEVKTGALQVYLLDEAAIARGDTVGNAALQSAAQATLTNPGKVVAALVSEWGRELPSDVEPEVVSAERHVLKLYFDRLGVPTFESQEDLVLHLNGL